MNILQGGRWSKGGRDIFKIQGELAKMGKLKNSGGVWTLDMMKLCDEGL